MRILGWLLSRYTHPTARSMAPGSQIAPGSVSAMQSVAVPPIAETLATTSVEL